MRIDTLNPHSGGLHPHKLNAYFKSSFETQNDTNVKEPSKCLRYEKKTRRRVCSILLNGSH